MEDARFSNFLTKISRVHLSWVVCISAALFPFYDFVQMNIFNAISVSFMHTFHLSASRFGNLSAFYLYSSVLVIFPVGLILDRFSTKKMLIMALCFSILGTLFLSVSPTVTIAQISRFIAGIGGSFSFLTVFILATRWFPSSRIGTIMGLVVTIAMLGGITAQTPLTILVEKMGWRHALGVDVALGILILIIIWCNVEDYPSDLRKTYKQLQHQHYALGFLKSIMRALKSKQTWLCSGYTSLLNLPIMVLGAVWGRGYLTTVYAITAEQASYVTSMIFMGTLIGATFFGWWSDYLALRRLPMVVGAFFSIIIILCILYSHGLTLSALVVLFLLLGFSSSSQVISYPLIAESNSPLLTGANQGIVATVIVLGGAVFQPIFGWLMDKHKMIQHVVVPGVYTASDYNAAMLILPIAFLSGLIFTCFIKETHCKPIVTEGHLREAPENRLK